jgi:hypothetical protein
MARDSVPKNADYDTVISKLFNDLRQKHGDNEFYDYTKDELVEAMESLKADGKVRHIRNIPDIKYTYDARRDFPADISSTGFWGIIGTKKSHYRMEKIPQNNLIRIPIDTLKHSPKKIIVPDNTPSVVDVVLGRDEQATMTRLRYSDVISKFLKMDAYQVQGHERTTISCGQIEVDEIYIGHKADNKYVIPISAKGGDKDCLSYTQALNLSLYAQEKARFKGYEPIPLGVIRLSNLDTYIVRFNAAKKLSDMKIEEVAIFEFAT